MMRSACLQEAGYDGIVAFIDRVIPDTRVVADVRAVLERTSGQQPHVRISCNQDLPSGALISVLTKAFFKEYTALNCGAFKVMAAIGNLEPMCGSWDAQYGFVTLWYTEQIELKWYQFHAEESAASMGANVAWL
ncbi:MAG: hypothetical protein LC772_11080 [Chloroflexi bacterium]|nr:hypothetical protein [Chloroflexota bacterium]